MCGCPAAEFAVTTTVDTIPVTSKTSLRFSLLETEQDDPVPHKKKYPRTKRGNPDRYQRESKAKSTLSRSRITMQLKSDKITRTGPESDIYESVLQLDGKRILDLGCGDGEKTIAIASNGKDRQLLGLEVDMVQHKMNEKYNSSLNVSFQLGKAQKIPAEDNIFDVVFMFMSLHHVPVESMDAAFCEIHRVLKPEGIVYISEPIFDGKLNEIVRLFHDEEKVRQAAFDATKRAVESDKFTPLDEIFFHAIVKYSDFDEFERRVINVSYETHSLDQTLMQQIREEFEKHMTPEGASFEQSKRVDLLQKCKGRNGAK
jgi:ubiquinone/menaquinone biosynthesis C-methylase UbiE